MGNNTHYRTLDSGEAYDFDGRPKLLSPCFVKKCPIKPAGHSAPSFSEEVKVFIKLIVLLMFTAIVPLFAAEPFSNDSLINYLQSEKDRMERAYQSSVARGCSKQFLPTEFREKFHLAWLLKPEFNDSLELILYKFSDGGGFRGQGPSTWVQHWEESYLKRPNAKLDPDWVGPRLKRDAKPIAYPLNGRSRFINSVLMQLAYRAQRREGALDLALPWTTNSFEQKAVFLNIQLDPAVSTPEFQRNYEIYHRMRRKRRAPYTGYPSERFFQSNIAAMKRLGIKEPSTFMRWKPRLAAWHWQKAFKEKATDFADSIHAAALSPVPLAISLAWAIDSNDIGNLAAETRFFEFYYLISADLTGFFDEVRKHLDDEFKPALSLGDGAKNWAAELLIQWGLYYSLVLEDLTPFQMTKENRHDFLSPSNPIFLQSQLSLVKLNAAIKKRWDDLGK